MEANRSTTDHIQAAWRIFKTRMAEKLPNLYAGNQENNQAPYETDFFNDVVKAALEEAILELESNLNSMNDRELQISVNSLKGLIESTVDRLRNINEENQRKSREQNHEQEPKPEKPEGNFETPQSSSKLWAWTLPTFFLLIAIGVGMGIHHLNQQELKRILEESRTSALLEDCRRSYRDEMDKHTKNDQFILPDDLNKLHHQSKEAVIWSMKEKWENQDDRSQLSSAHIQILNSEMDAWFVKYQTENDMTLNWDTGEAPAIGIDLGTTHCCVGVFYRGKVHIIPNLEQGNDLTTPSYVAFNDDGSTTVGKAAKNKAYINPENTIYDAKRIIGRKMDDSHLQSDRKFWPFEVKEDEGVPKIAVRGKLMYPEEISAKLLSYFRNMAEAYLKLDPGTIRKAVITVPAYFNDGQRQATVDAGKVAGLQVLTILNEPSAAAIAYTMERFDANPKNILIYDLGGGTFDVAVLKIKSHEIEVLGVGGDTHLGGEDFDKKLMEYCANEFRRQTGIDLLAGKDSNMKQVRDSARKNLRRLQTECENAKKNLASGTVTTVTVDAVHESMDLRVKVTREKFEELNEEYFENTIRIVAGVLRDVKLRKDQIDDIVLVGGSSRIPKIQKMLESHFKGKALCRSINPDEAVAYGAAVQAAIVNGMQTKGKMDYWKLQDVTPFSLGIKVVTGELSVIIPRNANVPTKKKEVYYTVNDHQERVHIEIFQGEELEVATNNKLLGDFMLEGIPSAPAGMEPIDVWMQVNSMGILHVEAVIRSTNGSNSVTVKENKQRMSEETIKRLIGEA